MGSYPSDIFRPLDKETFTSESKMAIDFIADYYKSVETYPVLSQVEPGYLNDKLPTSAPYSPETMESILEDVKSIILPGLTHWLSPNFFGYFPSTTSTAGFVGEVLCSGLDVVGFSWISSPAATELENVVIDWVGKMLKLPPSFLFSGTGGGAIYGATCEAILCTMAAARDKALKLFGHDKITKLVVYASDQAHSSFSKGAKLVGIPPSNFRIIPTDFSSEFALSPKALEDAIEDDKRAGLIPLYLCTTIGSTTSTAVDPIEGLGKVANKYGLWLHIDAAFAGSALICPEFRHYLNGVELANSISMNLHKWLLVTLDCCCMWLKEPQALTDSLTTSPEYLRNNATEQHAVVDYKDWQISLSRRFRAIKLWVVLRRYGIANLTLHIRSNINMAKRFESLVESDSRFEIVVPAKFSLVCFRLKPRQESNDHDPDGRKLNTKLLSAINGSGRAFLTHSVIGGIYVIRCAIGATLTEDHHIEYLWKLVQEKASLISFECFPLN